mmetsp:Transcript_3714/g.4224  ORF Transcript_3714/g.4224 Transcript_3714/m.4224 type:complete len:419 (+) Transcript_3714:58-1314(+)
MADEYNEEEGDACENWNTQNVLFVCLNAVSGFASIAGSSIIIYIILSAGHRRLQYVHCRLLLGMSIVDILNSAALGLSFIPAPRDIPCSLGYGTTATCTAQGFFMQLGLAVPGYMAMLSIYYLAIISFSIPEESIAKKIEPFMHAIALLPMLIAAIVGASESLFFSRAGHCWVQESQQCVDGDCREFTLGDGRWLVIVSSVWIVLMTSVIFICAFSISCKMRKRAVATRRLLSQEVQGEVRIDGMVRESFRQAILYVVGFTLTYMWTGLSLISPADADGRKMVFHVLTALFLPLQGFWNFIIFIRPSFVALREEDKDLSFIGVLNKIIFEDKEGERNPQSSRREILQRISFPVHLPVNVNISAEEPRTTLGHKNKNKNKSNLTQTQLCPDLRASAPKYLDGAVAPAMPSRNCEEPNIC